MKTILFIGIVTVLFVGVPAPSTKQCTHTHAVSWLECAAHVTCDSTCTAGAVCQFPLCNQHHLCECSDAVCTVGADCDTYQIQCGGAWLCNHLHRCECHA